jgi:uncharacterized membrane protein affecting hemolysin expression
MCVLTTTLAILRFLVDFVALVTAATILMCLALVTVIFELVNVFSAFSTQRALTVKYARLDIMEML